VRILLVQPEVPAGVGLRTVALPEPLHLEMAAALVPDHDVQILDLRVDNSLNAALRRFWPEMVAVTALTPEVYAAQHVLAQVKSFSAEIFAVVGGHHATLVPRDFFLPQVDAVAVGEAELMFRELVEAVADRRGLQDVPNIFWRQRDGTFLRNARSESRVNLGDLPLPRRDLTEPYRNEFFFLFDKSDTSIATSRGCPFRCLYRQRDIGPYYELVRAGKMTIADCKRGKRMLDTLAKTGSAISRKTGSWAKTSDTRPLSPPRFRLVSRRGQSGALARLRPVWSPYPASGPGGSPPECGARKEPRSYCGASSRSCLVGA
jgi:hypothetical protein